MRTRWQLLKGSVYLWNLDAEFTRCIRWPGQSSIIDSVTNVANVKALSNPNPNNHLLSLSTNCSII